MKRYLIIIILLLMFYTPVFAKGCTPVTGTGNDIGDEVECAGEHFYVIDNKDHDLVLMAKYNLMLEGKCELVIPGESEWPQMEIWNYIDEHYPYVNFGNYPHAYFEWKSDGNGNTIGAKICVPGTIRNQLYKQDPRAIAFKGDVDNLQFPYEGLYFNHIINFDDMNAIYDYDVKGTSINFGDFINEFNNYYYNNSHDGEDFVYKDYVAKDVFINIQSNGSKQDIIYRNYKKYLTDNHINVKDIRNLDIEELVSLIKKVSDSNYSLENFSNSDDWQVINGVDGSGIQSSHIVISDFKNLIPENKKWIYGTTYWLDSISLSNQYPGQLFVTTLGQICVDDICSSPSVGLRPIIVVDEMYKIITKTDGNGTIEVIDTAYADDEVTFRVSAKNNYTLVALVITTESGTKITFNRGDITDNHDGTYTINNSFIMPEENIIIEGRFVPKNPLTGRNYIIIIGVFLLLFIFGTFVLKKENK